MDEPSASVSISSASLICSSGCSLATSILSVAFSSGSSLVLFVSTSDWSSESICLKKERLKFGKCEFN